MRTLTGLLLALWLAPVITPDITSDRLRSYDQGREDAQAGLITPGDKHQSDYDTGYREQQQQPTERQTYPTDPGENQ
jgi:hypothetical protein